MSQILKRPMFKKGGPVMEGIMDGIVDRQQMQTGGPAGRFFQGTCLLYTSDAADE